MTADLSLKSAVYGAPEIILDTPLGAATQTSPLIPGAEALETFPDGALGEMTMLAPPGVIERRYGLAQSLRALTSGGRLTVLAPKDKGGSRLRKELEAFGCEVIEEARRHHRICMSQRPQAPSGLQAAIEAGAPRLDPVLKLWTQPGVFSWDRLDPGSLLLAETLPRLKGQGADLGCGVGWWAKAVLAVPAVRRLDMVDIDRRAIEAARRNIDDPRAAFHWADARGDLGLSDLDFVLMNAPFHDSGTESKGLGLAFITAAHKVLGKGGVLWMVANRHLPYEAKLKELFKTVTPRADRGGFKVFEARR